MAGASAETRMALSEANDAEHEWKRHYAHCPSCGVSVRTRGRMDPCAIGGGLRTVMRELQAELRQSRKLDKTPNPDQEMLF